MTDDVYSVQESVTSPRSKHSDTGNSWGRRNW